MQWMELKTEFKFDDAALGEFGGYANVSGVVDRQLDRVIRGAFQKDLQEKGPDRVLCWQHQHDSPIGTVKLTEDSHGLRVVRGKLVMEVQRAKEAYFLLRAGAITSMSIGYTVDDYRMARGGIRELTAVQVNEVSLVTHPACVQAVVDAVKDEKSDIEDLISAIRSSRLSIQSDRARKDADELRTLIDGLRNFTRTW